jgi:hypothetical protein
VTCRLEEIMEPVTVAQKAPAPFASTRTSIEEILSPSKSLCLPVDTDYLLGRVKNVLAPWLVIVDGHFYFFEISPLLSIIIPRAHCWGGWPVA